MSEEEKKAIERFKANANYCITSKETTQTILNLIETQQKELGKEKEKNKKLIDGQIETLEKILAPKLLEKFIIKDKINEKIEEYEEILESTISNEDYKKEVEHIIRVLEELKGE